MVKASRLSLLVGVVSLIGAANTGVAGAESLNRAGAVTAVAGPVTVARLAATPQPLKFRDPLYWRDVVQAHKDGIARVLLGGKAAVTVRELSSLELREERLADGVRYAVELATGKVRASVARMLMGPGERVEVRTRNAVASVRGTDFIVETGEWPTQPGAFGLLERREVAPGVAGREARAGETVVVTLSGVVEVSNRLAGTGRVEQVGASQAVRVSGRQDPVRFKIAPDDLRVLVKGSTPPRPQEARSGDKTDAVGSRVERVALVASAQSVPASERVGRSADHPRGDDQDGSQSSHSAATTAAPTPTTPPVAGASSGKDQSDVTGLGLGLDNGHAQGEGHSAALPATPLAPASPEVATPASVVGSPATPATPATSPTPKSGVAAPAVPATPAAPAIPARLAVPTIPAAAVVNPGNAQGVGQALGKTNAGPPPGQAKK